MVPTARCFESRDLGQTPLRMYRSGYGGVDVSKITTVMSSHENSCARFLSFWCLATLGCEPGQASQVVANLVRKGGGWLAGRAASTETITKRSFCASQPGTYSCTLWLTSTFPDPWIFRLLSLVFFTTFPLEFWLGTPTGTSAAGNT